jgi:DNA-directed RNA polymerase subunit RPC12/RpoP
MYAEKELLMATTFTCPSCGAGLDYDGDDDPVVRCSYCGSTVVVPAEFKPQRPVQVQAAWSTGPLTIDLSSLTSMAAKLKAVKQLVVDGQIPEAAQLYQQTVGASPEESAAAVQQLASGQSVVISSSSSVSTSIPVVSGTRVVTGEEAAEMLREQLGAASQQGRQLSRVITNVILAIVIGFVIVFGIVFVVFMLSLGR